MRIKENKKLGLKLKEIRKRNNMTQLEMSENMQVHINTIKRYEKGLSIPKEYLKKISDFFDLDIEARQELILLFESDENLEKLIEIGDKKIYFIDNLIELYGYKIYSKYKGVPQVIKNTDTFELSLKNKGLFFDTTCEDENFFDKVIVEDLTTGIFYNKDTNNNIEDILGIYDEIEWYIKALIKRYLNNK